MCFQPPEKVRQLTGIRGHATKCQWLDRIQNDKTRMGCRWCASIMTRSNASCSVPEAVVVAYHATTMPDTWLWRGCPPGRIVRACFGHDDFGIWCGLMFLLSRGQALPDQNQPGAVCPSDMASAFLGSADSG